MLFRGLRRACPWCGGRHAFFTGWFHKTEHCRSCGLRWRRGDVGFELGAASMAAIIVLGPLIVGLGVMAALTWPDDRRGADAGRARRRRGDPAGRVVPGVVHDVAGARHRHAARSPSTTSTCSNRPTSRRRLEPAPDRRLFGVARMLVRTVVRQLHCCHSPRPGAPTDTVTPPPYSPIHRVPHTSTARSTECPIESETAQ